MFIFVLSFNISLLISQRAEARLHAGQCEMPIRRDIYQSDQMDLIQTLDRDYPSVRSVGSAGRHAALIRSGCIHVQSKYGVAIEKRISFAVSGNGFGITFGKLLD